MQQLSDLSRRSSVSATGHHTKLGTLVSDVRAAAARARSEGDVATADALERQAQLLIGDIEAAHAKGMSSARVTSSEKEMTTQINAEDVTRLWSQLEPVKTLSVGNVCVFDCGLRGTATITSGAVLFSGALALEPIAAVLVAQHAKQFYCGRGTAFGSKEFLFNVAVANFLTGSEVEALPSGLVPPEAVTAQARLWRPLFGNSPTGQHPVRPPRVGGVAIAQLPSDIS